MPYFLGDVHVLNCEFGICKNHFPFLFSQLNPSLTKIYKRFLTIVGFLQDESIDDILFDQLEKATAEARNAKQDAFQETINRGKAEKDAIGAIRRVNLL